MLDATTRLNEDNSQALDIRSDGALLRGRIFRPRGTPKAAVVVHGAIGAPAGFYRAFAEWAASERDLAVLTYDYRDFGASARAPVRGSRATLTDLGTARSGGGIGDAGANVSRDPALGGRAFGRRPLARLAAGDGQGHADYHDRCRADPCQRPPAALSLEGAAVLVGAGAGGCGTSRLSAGPDGRPRCRSAAWGL